MLSDRLNEEYELNNLDVREFDFVDAAVEGVIIGNVVYKSARIEDAYEENVLKCHELMHYYTTPCNLFAADHVTRAKFERIAVRDCAKRLCSLDALISLYFKQIRTAEEIAEALEITPAYVHTALNYYKETYGNRFKYKGYSITLCPFRVRDEKEKRRLVSSQQDR